MARKRTPYAMVEDRLIVESAASGIHTFVRLVDGLPQLHFKGENKLYMYVDDVIQWHEKELRESGGKSGNQRVIDALKAAKEKFAAGDIKVQEG